MGTFVHSTSRQVVEFLHNSVVCVDETGKIVRIEKDVGEGELQTKAQAAIDELEWPREDVHWHVCEPGQFFFPGFIGELAKRLLNIPMRFADCVTDTHIHASQYPNAGIFGKSTLLDWLETYTFPLEASLSSLPKARQVYTACVRRTLSHGTTTAAYYATIDVAATNLLADLCLSIGQRAFVGRVCMDDERLNPNYYRDESAEASIRKTKEVIEHIEKVDPGFDIVAPILTPRFAPSCSVEAMTGLGELQREKNLAVQTHISENKGEVELVADMFPGSKSYAGVYDMCGLLTSRTVLAHAVHVTTEEADLIASRGAKVSHCPCSNSSITSGAARVRWLWSRGVEVGLGTDVSGGYSPSVLEAARQAVLVSRHVAMGVEKDGEEKEGVKLTVEEVLYLATRGGAKCLGLEEKVGGFEVGMDWDAQMVGLAVVGEDGERVGEGNVDMFGWENWEERMAKWLYNGDDRNTKKVWVKGRLVHERK